MGYPLKKEVFNKKYSERERIDILVKVCERLKEESVSELKSLPRPKQNIFQLLVTLRIRKPREVYKIAEDHNLFILDMISDNFGMLNAGKIGILNVHRLLICPSEQPPYYQFYPPSNYEYKREIWTGIPDDFPWL